MAKNKKKGGVSYYKPLSVCKKGTALVGYKTQYGTWYDIRTKTKPIAWSTEATRGWLDILCNESNSWEELLSKANGDTGEYLQDKEAVEVIRAYMNCKAPFEKNMFN